MVLAKYPNSAPALPFEAAYTMLRKTTKKGRRCRTDAQNDPDKQMVSRYRGPVAGRRNMRRPKPTLPRPRSIRRTILTTFTGACLEEQGMAANRRLTAMMERLQKGQ